MAKGINKVYVLNGSVYKSEATFLKNIKSMVDRDNFEGSWLAKKTFQIYEIAESGTLLDYKKGLDQNKTKNERDLQLKTLLDQLDSTDTAIINVIDQYSSIEKDERKRESHLRNLNNNKFNIEEFKKYIMSNKDYLFRISSDVSWIKSLLLIHNFRDCNASRFIYDRSQGKYVRPPVGPELANAFMTAKKEIKLDKRKNKC